MKELPKNSELAKVKGKPVGLKLTKVDLAELLLGAYSNNKSWTPGNAIQISTYEIKYKEDDNFLYESKRILLDSGKYKERIEQGNTILRPEEPSDSALKELVKKLRGLNNFRFSWNWQFFKALVENNIVDGITIFPNSSLIKPSKFIGSKVNGVLVELKEGEGPTPDILALIRNYGRHIGLYVLKEIWVESFASRFAGGEELKPPGAKICDFYYDDTGNLYLLVAAGGVPTSADMFSGSHSTVQKRTRAILDSQRKALTEIALNITNDIGGGVRIEEIVIHPYIYYDPEQGTLVSGGYEGPNVIVNSGKECKLELFRGTGEVVPIGIPPDNLLSEIIRNIGYPTDPVMTLTPVRNFGLPGC